MKPELKRQIGLIMDRHPVFSTALIARRCFASKSASNEYHFGRPGIPVTLRELEEKMMRDVLSDDHFKHMAKVMVERMVSSVKGEFNIEAKTVKTEVEKLLKSSEKSRESTAAASTSSVNNASAAVPAQRNKRGSNKENDESKEGPVNTKTAEQPQKKPARGGKRGQSKKAAEKTEEVKAEVKTEVKEEVKTEVKPAEKAKRGAPAAKKAKKAEIVQEKPVAEVKKETDKPIVTAAPVGAPFPAPAAPKRISRRGGVEATEQPEVKTEAKPEVQPVEKAKTVEKAKKVPAAKRAKKADTDAKVSPKTEPAIVVPAAQADQKSPVDNKPKEDTLAPTPPAPAAKAPAVVKSTGAGRKRKNATATAPEKETLAPAGIIEKVVVSPTKAPATVVKPVEKPGRKRKNATALAPVISNAKVQKIVAAAGPATVVKAATAKGPTGPIIGSTAPLAKIITGSPGSPSRIAITGNNLVSLSSLTQPLPPQVVLPTTPLPAGPAQVQSVKSSPPPPQVIQLRPAGTSFSHGSTGSNPMQIRPLRAAGVGIGGAGGPRPQFFKIVGGKPVQISNLQRLPAGSTVSALQQAPAGSRVVYMRAPAPGAGSSAAPGSQAASVVVTSSSASPTSSATAAAAGGAATASGGPPGATAVSGTGNKIILLSNKGQAIPVSGKGGVGGGPSIVRIVSPNSLTTTSGGKLALAPNSPTKVLRPAGGATGPILLRTVAPRPGNSTAAPPIQLPMAPLPKSALTNNPNPAGGGGSVVTVSAAGEKSAVKIMSQTEAATAKAIQVLLPKNPLPPTGSNIVGATTTTTGPTSPQKSGSGLAMTTTTTTTTASGAFVWTNSTRANFKLSSRINFASLDKFKNVVNKDVHFILASIVTEDKSNEFSFRLHLKREPVSKAKKASGELSQPIQQQSYLELEGKAKVPTAQEWSLKVKTEPPVFLVSKGTFLSDFPAVRIPKEIAEKPFVDYELHIDKCSPMQVASTTTAAATPSASATPRPATTAAPAPTAAAPPPAPTSGAASKPTGNTGGGTSALPGKRVRKPKVQS